MSRMVTVLAVKAIVTATPTLHDYTVNVSNEYKYIEIRSDPNFASYFVELRNI